MKIGISTASFFNKCPTEGSFDVLRQLKCDLTEVFLNTYYEYEKPFVDAFASKKGMINVHSVHALPTQFEPELFSQNVRVRNDAELLFKKVCYAGHALGAKFYTFHGPLRLKNQVYNIDYERFGARLNQLIEIAQNYGLKLSYENVHYSYFNDPAFFKNIFKFCPKLYGTLDIKHAIIIDQNIFDFVKVMGDRISHIHVCDLLKNNDTALPGKGKINFEKLFKIFVQAGLVCPILMEVYSSDYSDLKEIKDSYQFLQACLVKAEKSKD